MTFLNSIIFSKAQTWGCSRRNSSISRPPLFMQLEMVVSWVDQRVCNGNVSVGFLQYNKHLFVHIGHANHSYSDPLLESVDIRQIYDKFPEKKGGLKELFGKGPQNAFFLVKFWVSKTLLLFQSFLSEWSCPTPEGRAAVVVGSHWLICPIARGSHTSAVGVLTRATWHSHMWTQATLPSLPRETGGPLGLRTQLCNDKKPRRWLESQWQTQGTRLSIGSQSSKQSEVTQLCPTLCHPVNCSLPGSSIHEISQARILEWLPFHSSGESPDPGIKPRLPALQADSRSSEPSEKPSKQSDLRIPWEPRTRAQEGFGWRWRHAARL